jgi:hypothetical protein
MSDADRYRKEQDLIFQEIEEMKVRERKARETTERALRAARIEDQNKSMTRLYRSTVFQKLLEALPPENQLELIIACERAWQEAHTDPETQI